MSVANAKGTGNPEVLEWCPVCVENCVSVRDRDGTMICPWCDTPVMPREEKEERLRNEEPVREVDMPEVEVPKIPPRRERRHNHGQPYSDEQMIARVILWQRVVGSPPSKRDWEPSQLEVAAVVARHRANDLMARIALYENGDWPAESTVRERFGSMNALISQAGFEPRPPGRPPKGPLPVFKPRPLEEIMEDIQSAREAGIGHRGRLRMLYYELAQGAIVLGDRTRG